MHRKQAVFHRKAAMQLAAHAIGQLLCDGECRRVRICVRIWGHPAKSYALMPIISCIEFSIDQKWRKLIWLKLCKLPDSRLTTGKTSTLRSTERIAARVGEEIEGVSSWARWSDIQLSCKWLQFLRWFDYNL